MDIKEFMDKYVRNEGSIFSKVMIPVMGVLFGIIVASFTVIPVDVSILQVFRHLFVGAFGNMYNFTDSLIYTIPLGFTGLAIVFSYQAGVFNIGAEGQLHLAAVATTIVATNFAFLPTGLHLTLAILMGAIAGAIWVIIPALLRAYKGFNEIILTMLLNYVAILFVGYLVQGPLKDPNGYYPQSAKILSNLKLSTVIPGTQLHSGIILFLVATLVVYFILFKTTLGFKIRNVGLNPKAADYAGTDVKKIIVVAMLISGALAGIAGSVEIMGVHHRLVENFSPGYGYDAIAVALLGELNPFGVILSAFFFGAIRSGANSLQIATGIPVSFVYIIQGLAVLFVIGFKGLPRFINRLKRRFRNVK